MLKRNALNVSKTNTEETFSFFFVKILKNKNWSMHYSLVVLSSWVKFTWNLLTFLTNMSFNYKRRLFFVVSFTSNIMMKTSKNSFFAWFTLITFSLHEIFQIRVLVSVEVGTENARAFTNQKKKIKKIGGTDFFSGCSLKCTYMLKWLHGRFF